MPPPNMVRAPSSRERVQPRTFCSGTGQLSLSQEAPAEASTKKKARGQKSPKQQRPTKKKKKDVAAIVPRGPVLPVLPGFFDDDDDSEYEDFRPPAQRDAAPPADEADEHFIDEEEEEQEEEEEAVPQRAQMQREKPQPKLKLSTGPTNFTIWWYSRRDAPMGSSSDGAQMHIMNAAPQEHPMDYLCKLTHVNRRKMRMAYAVHIAHAKHNAHAKRHAHAQRHAHARRHAPGILGQHTPARAWFKKKD